MAKLRNQRHETFARFVAEGMAKLAAYLQVYPSTSRDSARHSGCALAQRPDVAARIAEFQTEAAQEAVWALTERLEYLCEVATTPYGTVDDSSPLCVATRHKVQGVEFRTPDKLAALKLYSRLAGDFQPKSEDSAPNLLGEMIGEIRANTYDGEEWGAIIEDRAEAMGMPPRKVKTEEEQEQERLDKEREEDERWAPSGPIYRNGQRIGEKWMGGATEQEYALKREEIARRRAARAAGLEVEEEKKEERPAPPERTPGEPLRNTRHERFAHFVARGDTFTDAAIQVYGIKRATAITRGSEIANRPDVAARLAELRSVAADSVGWTLTQRLLYLKRLVQTPLSEITEGSWYCEGIWRNPRGVSYRIPNKLRALTLYTQLSAHAPKKTERDYDGLDRFLRKHPELAGR